MVRQGCKYWFLFARQLTYLLHLYTTILVSLGSNDLKLHRPGYALDYVRNLLLSDAMDGHEDGSIINGNASSVLLISS